MVTAVRSLGLQGISGYEVTVECFLSGGLPAFDIVGLGDTAVKESRERVRAAVKNCGVKFPVSRITVNLAPAGRKQEGTLYDLPILLGILASAEESKPPAKDAAFVGELSLTGTLRAVNGVLPMAMAAVRAGIRTLYVPAANAAEATLADGVTVYGVPDVVSLVQHLKGEKKLSPQPKWQAEQTSETGPDFSDVMGQENVKRALEIAAAGGHNILLIGSPGAGKSMLARRLPSILPDMTRKEALEATEIWSVAGLTDSSHPLLLHRPFRAPHHTLSAAAMAGGAPLNAVKAITGLTLDAKASAPLRDLLARGRSLTPDSIVRGYSASMGIPAVALHLSRWCYDLLRVKSGADPHFIIREKDELEKIAADASMKNLLSLTAAVAEMRRSAEHPLAPRQVWEGVLLVYVRALGGQVRANRHEVGFGLVGVEESSPCGGVPDGLLWRLLSPLILRAGGAIQSTPFIFRLPSSPRCRRALSSKPFSRRSLICGPRCPMPALESNACLPQNFMRQCALKMSMLSSPRPASLPTFNLRD